MRLAFSIAMRFLSSSKTQTLLIVLGIAIGVSVQVFIGSLIQGLQKDLVDEARKRIVQYCPEWTDYNLSDPGITLIELFAWMTELMVYRLNRVPDKNYVKFLELLGLQLKPASSARTDLTFWLSVSLPISEDNQQSVIIPRGFQVTADSSGNEEIVFSTDRALEIFPPKFSQLRKPIEVNKNFVEVESFDLLLPNWYLKIPDQLTRHG